MENGEASQGTTPPTFALGFYAGIFALNSRGNLTPSPTLDAHLPGTPTAASC